MIYTTPNPDLEVLEGNKSKCTHARHRRWGFHGLSQIARYSLRLRAVQVMTLEDRIDASLMAREGVRDLIGLPCFSAMVVIQGQSVLFEHYASDFGPRALHSIQSISKTSMHLVMGRLVDEGTVDLGRTVSHYVPEIGSGYASATVQNVLNMDVMNEYTEDFTDPNATYYRHEEAMGWRLPAAAAHEETQHSFLTQICSTNVVNRTGHVQYKDANTDVLAWIAERVSGRPLREFLADIVDAAGLEGALEVTTDRAGVPSVDGGMCLSARDLARYLSIFARGGRGVDGQKVGSESFLKRALLSGVPMPAPFERFRYSNHLMVCGDCVAHSGWGGQYAVVNLSTSKIAVFFSVLETEHALNRDYLGPILPILHAMVA